MRRAFSLFTSFVAAFLLSAQSPVPDAKHSPDKTNNDDRPNSELKLTERMVDFISTNFELPKTLVRETYKENLPKALNDSMLETRKGEKEQSMDLHLPLTGILNRLFGSRDWKNKKGIETIKANADAAKAKDIDPAKEGAALFQYFMTKVIEKADRILGTKPEKSKYVEADDEAKIETDKAAEEFKKLLAAAQTGQEPAVKALRDKYGDTSLLSFLRGQSKEGNVALANQLSKALKLVNNPGEPAHALGFIAGDKASAFAFRPGDDGSISKDQFARFAETVSLDDLNGVRLGRNFGELGQNVTMKEWNGSGFVAGKPPTVNNPPPPPKPDLVNEAQHLTTLKRLINQPKESCKDCHGPGREGGELSLTGNSLAQLSGVSLRTLKKACDGEMRSICQGFSPEETDALNAWAKAQNLGITF